MTARVLTYVGATERNARIDADIDRERLEQAGYRQETAVWSADSLDSFDVTFGNRWRTHSRHGRLTVVYLRTADAPAYPDLRARIAHAGCEAAVERAAVLVHCWIVGRPPGGQSIASLLASAAPGADGLEDAISALPPRVRLGVEAADAFAFAEAFSGITSVERA